MKQDDVLTLTIADLGVNGEGIAKCDGHTVFVPFALPGETVEAKVTHVKKDIAFARVVRVVAPSVARVKAPCIHYEKCGGCDLMHVRYADQLAVKRDAVATTLRKAGVTAEVLPPVPSPKELAYRNKIVLPFGLVEGRVVVGFYREGTHRVVSITRCLLHDEWATRLIEATLAWARDNALSVYDSASGRGLLRHLIARRLGEHVDVTVVINARELPAWRRLDAALGAVFADYSLYVSVNTRRNNVVMGEVVRLLAGRPYTHTVMGIRVEVNPLSFLQVNDDICARIYQSVLDVVAPRAGVTVVDAFAGVGVLGAVMAREGATVYNLEIVPEATADADRLAVANGVTVRNLCGDSAVLLPEVLAEVTAGRKVHDLHLRSPYFESIAMGRKRYELRLHDDKRRRIAVGDLICFESYDGRYMYCVVDELRHYDDFEALFRDLGTIVTGFGTDIPAEAAASTMSTIYTPAQQNECGALAIGLHPVNARGVSVVLDPPRKGCPEGVVQSLLSMANVEAPTVSMTDERWPTVTLPWVEQIVYISCNPATLARDAQALSASYEMGAVQPFDMFPETRHVEDVVRFTRLRKKEENA